jgi:hypothetical protein
MDKGSLDGTLEPDQELEDVDIKDRLVTDTELIQDVNQINRGVLASDPVTSNGSSPMSERELIRSTSNLWLIYSQFRALVHQIISIANISVFKEFCKAKTTVQDKFLSNGVPINCFIASNGRILDRFTYVNIQFTNMLNRGTQI